MSGVLKFVALGVIVYLLLMAWGLALGISNHMPAEDLARSVEALVSAPDKVLPTPNASPEELERLWGGCPLGRPEDVIRKLPDLPLTTHAKVKHINEKWNSTTLVPHLQTCRPLEFWICPERNQIYILCKLAGEPPKYETGGVIVGWDKFPGGGIVTGYASKKWNHPGCFGPLLIP